MSSTIKQAIEALKSRVADAYTAIVAKGGTLPATQDSVNLPSAIASIPSGGSGNEIWESLTYGYQTFANSQVEFEVIANNGIPASTLSNCFKNSHITNANIHSVVCPSLESAFEGTGRLDSLSIDSLPLGLTSLRKINFNSSVTNISLLGDCPNCTDLFNSFTSCISLIECTIPSIGSATRTAQGYQTFSGCRTLEKVTIYNSGTIYLNYCWQFFNGCVALKEVIGILDISASNTNGDMFYNCSRLESVYVKGAKSSMSVSQCPLLSYDSLLYLVQNVQSVSNQTLTLGSANISKLNATAEGQAAIAAAQALGWTIA